MRRSLCLFLLLAALVVGVVSQGCAQFSDENQKWSVFGGVYMPSGSELTDMGSSAWMSFGLGMNMKTDASGRPKGVIGLDYAGSKKSHFSASKISLSYTHYFRQPAKADNARGMYFGVGLSANALKEKIDARPFLFPPVLAEDNSGIKVGVHALVGYDISQSLYLEAKYAMMTELAPDANFSGLTLSIGSRSLF